MHLKYSSSESLGVASTGFQQTFTCFKTIIGALEEDVKYS